MGYSLYDAEGYKGDVASIGGWWDLITEVDKVRDTGPLADFINTGKTTNPKAVIKELDELIPSITDSTIRSTLEGLRDNLKKCKEVGIISG